MNQPGKPTQPLRDPWSRVEAWRYHPSINKSANVRRMFPGLGWAVGAFVIACVLEKVFEKPDDSHHWGLYQLYRLGLSRIFSWSEWIGWIYFDFGGSTATIHDSVPQCVGSFGWRSSTLFKPIFTMSWNKLYNYDRFKKFIDVIVIYECLRKL